MLRVMQSLLASCAPGAVTGLLLERVWKSHGHPSGSLVVVEGSSMGRVGAWARAAEGCSAALASDPRASERVGKRIFQSASREPHQPNKASTRKRPHALRMLAGYPAHFAGQGGGAAAAGALGDV
eukprot:364983-Chlamydomonas_euryale.AAC.7